MTPGVIGPRGPGIDAGTISSTGAPGRAPDRVTGSAGVAAGDGLEVIRARYGLDHRHGRCVLRDALTAVGGVNLDQVIWLDIETTGLAGGTGTYAFLVSLAYLDGSALVIEQLLLRRLSGERHLLASLQDRLHAATHLVTFNGRRFDWPILEARFILVRQQPAVVKEHTDLIHPSRWLWHRVLGTHRLSTLEAEVLGAPRPDDIPGWQIPMMYVEYLRSTDRAILNPILTHNRADLLAMIVLHGEVARILRDPLAAGVPLDWEGAGVLLGRQGRYRPAVDCFERAAEQTHEPRGRWRVLRRLIRQHRLLGDADRARARWEAEAEAWPHRDRFRAHVLEEVAKARGRRGDVVGARRAAEEGLALTRTLDEMRAPGAFDLSRLADRLRVRLERLSQAART